FLAFALLILGDCGNTPQMATRTPVAQVVTGTSAPQSVTGTPAASAIFLTPTWTVGDHGVQWAQVSFDDLAPSGMDMQQCWNGLGMDDQGRIYIGFTSVRSDGREDFPVFRYDPKTGERLFLGTFLDIVAAAGNSRPGEGIPKGHTRMVFVDGKMYMGSQSFHDL